MADTDIKPMSFEKALEELEAIVEKLVKLLSCEF